MMIRPLTVVYALLFSVCAMLFAVTNASAADAQITDYKVVPSGDYVLDPRHSTIVVTVRHNGISDFSLTMGRYDAKLIYDSAHLETSSVQVTVDPIHVNTSDIELNGDLQKARYFNTNMFPEIKFVSTGLKLTGGNKGVLTGNLTMVGLTKPVALDVTFNGMDMAENGPVIGFSARGTIRRADFNIGEGSMGLGPEIQLTISAEFHGRRPGVAQPARAE